MSEHDEEFEGEEGEEGEEDTSELEAEFTEHWKKHEARIQKHVDAAARELQKAVDIADEEGIPFYASVSFLGQNYTPPVLEKFSALDKSTIEEITGTWNEYDTEGWQHSDVC